MKVYTIKSEQELKNKSDLIYSQTGCFITPAGISAYPVRIHTFKKDGNSTHRIEAIKTAKIEDVKKGEYIRPIGTKKVYTREAFCRFNKKYECSDHDDISNYRYFKKGTLVEIDFEY